MKLAVVALALLVFAALSLIILPEASTASTDPCDVYGNCISSSISYVRSNPDHSLYLGDEFSVTSSVSLGSITRSYSLSWSYDGAVFIALGGGLFQVVGNVSATYPVTIKASFTMVEKVGNSTVTLFSSLSTSQSVETQAFVLTLQTELSSVTDSAGRVLRNPDGSFYHDDKFFLNYTYSFPFMQERPDIKVAVEPHFDPSFVTLGAYENASSTGYFVFTVANKTGTSNIQVTGQAFNYQGSLLGTKEDAQPFAVVDYAPHFTYLTYLDYNSLKPSSYERPFVTLVRYDWNDPGYNYSGDSNTAPIVSRQDLGERAWVNNFTYASEGWKVSTTFTSGQVNNAVSFANSTVGLGIVTTNQTRTTMNPGSVVKYYFLANQTTIRQLVERGSEYFNVTVGFRSDDFAGGHYTLFNTTYLYEPIFLNGNLTFFAYSGESPDPHTNITLTVQNETPLNNVLTAQVVDRFGNDSSVLHAFSSDLYPASDTVQRLSPSRVSDGVWSYVINQTNWSGLASTQLPVLTISASEGSSNVSYSIPEAGSMFEVGRSTLANPFGNITGDYLDQGKQLLMLPLNFSFIGSAPYLVWAFGGNNQPFQAATPYFLTTEPGNLSRTYAFIFGEDNSVNVNLKGGGGVSVFQRGYVSGGMYAIDVFANETSGGIVSVTAIVNGKQVVLSSIPPNSSPFTPPSFYGISELEFPGDYNGTVSFQVTNAWGATWTAGSADITYLAPALPTVPAEELGLFVLLLVGLSLLANQVGLRRADLSRVAWSATQCNRLVDSPYRRYRK